ncbi:MAG: hypothetical protein ABFQ53_00330 [Patescibacteria group bacterium]
MNKNVIIIIIEGIIVFALVAYLLLFDLDFRTFNLVEGIYWVSLGIFVLTLSKIISSKYQKLTLFASGTLILFGLSDFIEISTGAYWEPWWLLALNIFCILGLIVSFIWYIKLRYSK